ncbi:hypothetical protein CDAR_535361 [Caerostris darwini]|uniref:Uncharacterized protein n=1 Tax=Caerostris darwini TaxID=1538125 RepID=A0AAV4V293_9ARAC|nr:hypothetical protein CDAR_535361 [Caerostris darwini]
MGPNNTMLVETAYHPIHYSITFKQQKMPQVQKNSNNLHLKPENYKNFPVENGSASTREPSGSSSSGDK